MQYSRKFFSLFFAGMLAVASASCSAENEAPAASPVDSKLTEKNINDALKKAYDKYKGLKEGANANYIPALDKVDSNIFGIVLVTVDGKVYSVGDIESEVSIQSISKVFTMAKVTEEKGIDALPKNVGVDATGQVFNSIYAIEQNQGHEMNPLVNAGAITTTSMVQGKSYNEIWNKILGYYSDFAGRDLTCWKISTSQKLPPTSVTRQSHT